MALITKSANDAAVVVAEALGGRETKFARTMTKKARALGMTRTRFRNASGLPNRRQLSTARDMATLARALVRDFPQYYKLFSTERFTFAGRTHRNHNRLLRQYSGTDGIKTGYIRASGFNVVASAVRDGERLIAVVFGGKTPRSRDRHAAKLLDRGFTRLAALGPEKIPPPPQPKPAIAATASGGTSSTQVADAAAAAPATPEAEPPAPDMGSAEKAVAERIWGVQVGAFYRYDPAKRRAIEAAQKAPDLLGAARVRVTHFKGRRGRIYRSRLVGLEEARARAACRRLVEVEIDCLVVRVGAKVALKQADEQVAAN
jgi:D-alanyl-D-alanine carboxypeptidase